MKKILLILIFLILPCVVFGADNLKPYFTDNETYDYNSNKQDFSKGIGIALRFDGEDLMIYISSPGKLAQRRHYKMELITKSLNYLKIKAQKCESIGMSLSANLTIETPPSEDLIIEITKLPDNNFIKVSFQNANFLTALGITVNDLEFQNLGPILNPNPGPIIQMHQSPLN